MSSLESIERKKEYERLKAAAEAKKARQAEAKRRIEELKADRADKVARVKDQIKIDNDKKNVGVVKAGSDEAMLQLRFPDGATSKQTFRAADKLAVVFEFVRKEKDLQPSTSFLLSSSGLPRIDYKEESQGEQTLSDLKLAPRAALIVKLTAGEAASKQLQQGTDVSTMYLKAFLAHFNPTNAEGKAPNYSSDQHMVLAITAEWCESWTDMKAHLEALRKKHANVCFGMLDADAKKEILAKNQNLLPPQDYAILPSFLIYQGLNKVETLQNPQPDALDNAVAKYRFVPTSVLEQASQQLKELKEQKVINNTSSNSNSSLASFTRESTEASVTPGQAFQVQVEGSPAQGLVWSVKSSNDSVTQVGTWTYAKPDSNNKAEDNDNDDSDGHFGTYTFVFRLSSSATGRTMLSFEYRRIWRPTTEAAVDQFELAVEPKL